VAGKEKGVNDEGEEGKREGEELERVGS